MQMAVVEAARNLVGLEGASSTEFGATGEPVVGLMTEWVRGNQLERRAAHSDLGGTMRLGAYPAILERGSKIASIYGTTEISERHRHRYEININYRDRLQQHGLRFAGLSPDGILPETVEYRGPSLVHRRAVPPRAEVATLRPAPAVRLVHRGGGGAVAAGVMTRRERTWRRSACMAVLVLRWHWRRNPTVIPAKVSPAPDGPGRIRCSPPPSAGTEEEPSRTNLLVSPGSLGAVLAFLDLGADARMHDALAKTLGLAAGPDRGELEALRGQAKALASVPPGQGPLAFANAVFVDPAGEIFPAAIDRLRDAGMAAEIEALNEPEGLAAINRWVSERTAGLIPTILDKPLDGAVLVALNALHFKDKWEDPFTAGQTSPQPFHLVGGGTKDVPMMRRHPGGLAFRETTASSQ